MKTFRSAVRVNFGPYEVRATLCGELYQGESGACIDIEDESVWTCGKPVDPTKMILFDAYVREAMDLPEGGDIIEHLRPILEDAWRSDLAEWQLSKAQGWQ